VTIGFSIGALFDSLTVAENIAFPLEKKNRAGWKTKTETRT